jgi:hypothetical protein
VSYVQGATAVTVRATPTSDAPPAAPTGSLMPSPTADNIDDAMTTVLVLLTKQQSTDLQNGESGVRVQKGERDRANAQQVAARKAEDANSSVHGTGFFGSIGKLVKDVGHDALHGRFDEAVGDGFRDVKAAVNSPHFWSDLEHGAKMVATVAAAVGGLAATVATAGAAGPIVVGAALALSAGGFAVSETHCLGKASAYVGLGMELGAAALSLGSATATSSALAAKVASKIGLVASGVSAESTIVEGGAHLENTKYAARATEAQADVVAASNDVAKTARVTDWLLDNLSAAAKAERDTTSTLQGIVQQHDAGNVTLASTRG